MFCLMLHDYFPLTKHPLYIFLLEYNESRITSLKERIKLLKDCVWRSLTEQCLN